MMFGGLFRRVRGLLWRRIILEARVVNVSTGSSLDLLTARREPHVKKRHGLIILFWNTDLTLHTGG